MGEANSDIPIFGSKISGYDWIDRSAAYAIFTNEVGAYAVVKEGPGYFLPGGGSESDETPEATVRREVKEELGRSLHILRKVGEAIQYFQAEGRSYKMLAVFFAAIFTDEYRFEGECELLWLTEDEIENKLFHECHQWAIKQV